MKGVLTNLLETLKELPEVELTPEKAAERIAYLTKLEATLEASDRMDKHLAEIIENKTAIVTGDMTHLTVKAIVKSFADVGKKPKYDFQKPTAYFDEVMRYVNGFMDAISSRRNADASVINEAIDGTGSITFDAASYSGVGQCYDCTRPLSMTVSGNTIHFHSTDKQSCKSNQFYTVDVHFPTGELVYADWPKRFSELMQAKLIPSNDDSVNYLKGMRASSDKMAKHNIMHMFVGNTSPALCYNPETHELKMGDPVNEVEQADGEWVDQPSKDYEGFEELGRICTDLWWFTLLDKKVYDDLVAQLPPLTEAQAKELASWHFKDNTGHIKPGTYRFTAYYGAGGDEDSDVKISGIRISD
jgi:hypothetical protein